jgi:hypothetical protein
VTERNLNDETAADIYKAAREAAMADLMVLLPQLEKLHELVRAIRFVYVGTSQILGIEQEDPYRFPVPHERGHIHRVRTKK